MNESSTTQRKHLGLPKGVIRSLITLIIILVYVAALGLQLFYEIAVPDSLHTIVITVVAFYFGIRRGESHIETSAKKVVIKQKQPK